ncbi:MAG: hypothetical protein WBA31_07020 [Candidatus Dormiibacterota bacterium]
MPFVIATLIVACLGASISAVYLWLSLRWRRLSVRPWPYVQEFRFNPAPTTQTPPPEVLHIPTLRITVGNRGEPGHSAVLLAKSGGYLWIGFWIPATRLQTGTFQMQLISSLRNPTGESAKVALVARDLDGRWWRDTDDEPRRLRNLQAAELLLSSKASAEVFTALRIRSLGDSWKWEVDTKAVQRPS